MLKTILAVSLSVNLALANTAEPAVDRYRAIGLHAFAEVGSEYCPGVQVKAGASDRIQAATGYGEPVSDADQEALKREKQELFDLLRQTSRERGCELLLHQFGPGTAFDLLEFR